MNDRPQTNLQLLNALRGAGYTDADVAQIKRAYDFVARQFAVWFRASGKPFIAHLVGTAGILGALRARAPVIAAGLGHALYAQGELPRGVPGPTGSMRARVRRALGTETEDLIARYAALEWSTAALPALRARIPEMSATDREVVLIRLANELDDHLDLEALYCGNAEARRTRIGKGLRIAADMARDLNAATLAASLERALDATLATELPSALRTERAASFSIAPASPIRRQSTKAWRLAGRAVNKGLRLLGRRPRSPA
jgi:(p)ppGpp synthase/HD superfamily hydrolase